MEFPNFFFVFIQFIGGKAVVCGGAVQRYHGCKWESGEEGRGYRRCEGKIIPPPKKKMN